MNPLYHRALTPAIATLALTACANAMAHHERPPAEYRAGTLTQIEFVRPAAVPLRCAARFVEHRQVPTVAGACSSADLMTVPNPCEVVDQGWYARMLCHELGRSNGWFE